MLQRRDNTGEEPAGAFAVIFDLDGVLVDSERFWRKVDGSFLRGAIPHWNDDLQRSILGRSVYDVHALLCREHGLTMSHAEFRAFYRELAEDIYGRKSSLFAGAHECIQACRSAGAKLGVTSSSPRDWIVIALDRFDLREVFSAIVSSDDLGGAIKPSPRIYLEALRRLRVSAPSAIAIEDTPRGIESAKGAGIRVIGFRNGMNDHQDFSAADMLAHGFDEVIEVLRRNVFEISAG